MYMKSVSSATRIQRLLLMLPLLLWLSLAAKAQSFTPVAGRWDYKIFKVDSLIYMPNGPTATRPAPVANSYWVRFNTDSSEFEYSDGTRWLGLAIKPPSDTAIHATVTSDTTITITCGAFPGTYTTGYYHVNIPQYRGFRVRCYSGMQSMPSEEQYCAVSIFFSGPFYYTFNSLTGDLFVIGASDGGGNLFQITPY